MAIIKQSKPLEGLEENNISKLFNKTVLQLLRMFNENIYKISFLLYSNSRMIDDNNWLSEITPPINFHFTLPFLDDLDSISG